MKLTCWPGTLPILVVAESCSGPFWESRIVPLVPKSVQLIVSAFSSGREGAVWGTSDAAPRASGLSKLTILF
jgi:hypothetical protein